MPSAYVTVLSTRFKSDNRHEVNDMAIDAVKDGDQPDACRIAAPLSSGKCLTKVAEVFHPRNVPSFGWSSGLYQALIIRESQYIGTGCIYYMKTIGFCKVHIRRLRHRTENLCRKKTRSLQRIGLLTCSTDEPSKYASNRDGVAGNGGGNTAITAALFHGHQNGISKARSVVRPCWSNTEQLTLKMPEGFPETALRVPSSQLLSKSLDKFFWRILQQFDLSSFSGSV